MLMLQRCSAAIGRILGRGRGVLLGSSPAHAQWDMGMGWGMFGGFHQVPSPTGVINQQALAAAARPREGVPSRTPYANNPNSYINRVRDPGFVSHVRRAAKISSHLQAPGDSSGRDNAPAATRAGRDPV